MDFLCDYFTPHRAQVRTPTQNLSDKDTAAGIIHLLIKSDDFRPQIIKEHISQSIWLIGLILIAAKGNVTFNFTHVGMQTITSWHSWNGKMLRLSSLRDLFCHLSAGLFTHCTSIQTAANNCVHSPIAAWKSVVEYLDSRNAGLDKVQWQKKIFIYRKVLITWRQEKTTQKQKRSQKAS